MRSSYKESDMVFLLEETNVPMLETAEKELLIQRGGHYSDMLGIENPPDEWQMELYKKVLDREKERLAMEIGSLAATLAEESNRREIVLLCLARAGCPVGALLKRALDRMHIPAKAYGISIILDRRIDRYALRFVMEKHKDPEFFFVDGWTGKGAISRELEKSVPGARLVVLSDMCGGAWLSASGDDWLIPSGMLGSVISGLVSRTLWNNNGLHKAKYLVEMEEWDQTGNFLDAVSSLWTNNNFKAIVPYRRNIGSGKAIKHVMRKYGVDNINRVKPGLAEATRAVTRRLPEQVIISKKDSDLDLLLGICENNLVPVSMDKEIDPYKAITIIRKI